MSGLHIHICGIMLLALIAGCASSGETSRSANADNNSDRSRIEVNNTSIPLSDYLRRVPGVTVFGSGNSVRVNIRGATSFMASTEPLYVVDGQRVGRDYSRVASMVSVADIDHIRVLKGVEASAGYGLEGGNGVIEITTKK